MPTIRVAKPFTYQDAAGQKTYYLVGGYEVSDEVADDWFVKAHLEGYEPPPPGPGSPEYAEQQRQAILEREALAETQPVSDDPSAGMATRTTIPPAPLPPGTTVATPAGSAQKAAQERVSGAAATTEAEERPTAQTTSGAAGRHPSTKR